MTRPPLKGAAVPETQLRTCPQCGVPTHADEFFCANGHPVRCRSCQAPVRDTGAYCRHCGAPLGGLVVSPVAASPEQPVETLRPVTSQAAEPLAVPHDVSVQVEPMAAFRTPSEPTALPSLRTMQFQVGLAELAAGRAKDAVVAFERALDEAGGEPAEWELEFHRARALEGSDRHPDAVRGYLDAAARSPERLGTLLPFAHALLTPDIATSLHPWLGDDWVRQFDNDRPAKDRAEILLFIGRANLWAHEYGRAREAFAEGLKLAPDDARLVEGLAEAQWRTNELDSALEGFERARKLASAHPERLIAIQSKLAGVLVSLGRYEDALTQIDEILARSDRYAHELQLNRAQCYLALQRPADALVASDEAARRKPGTVAPHVVRAQALIALHRYAEAVTEVDTAMRLDPTRRTLMFCKAQALVEGQIDLDQAGRLLARCGGGMVPGELIPRSLVPGLDARSSDANLEFFFAFLNRLLDRPADALEHVERALDLGLTATGAYPETPAYLLKAEVLEKLDRRPEAGEYFLHAGSRIEGTDPVRAVHLLTKAVSYSPDLSEAHWYLAEALLGAATAKSDPPYVDGDYIRKGLEAWTRAYVEVGPPRPEWAWAYLTAAALLENAAKLGRETFANLGWGQSYDEVWWHAVAVVERSLLLDADSGYAWALLTGYFRDLDRYANALQTSARAVELDRTTGELGARAATLVQLGYEDAKEIVEEYLRLASPEEAPWGSMLEGYRLTGEDKYEDAIPHFDTALKDEPNEPIYLFHRGRTLSLAGKLDDARRDFEALLAATEPGQRFATLDNLQQRAWAAFALGRYAEAKEMLLRLVDEYGEGDHEIDVALTWCCVGLRDAKQADVWFKRALEHATCANELHETLQDLGEFERRLKAEGRRRELRRLAGYRRRAEARRKELPARLDDESHALAELLAVAKAVPPGSAAAFGCRASLGRMYRAAGRWRDAASEYSALAQRAPEAPMWSFPEAERGLLESIDGIVADADRHAAAVRTEDALEALTSALELVDSLPQGASRRPELVARIGYTRFALSGDVAAAHEAFTVALGLYREQGAEDAGKALADVLKPLFGSSRQFWDLDHRWDSLLEGAEQGVADGFATARASLAVFLDEHYGLGSDVGPYRDGVVVELGEHLVPEDTTPTGPLLGTYMPAWRAELMEAWLFEPPGVLFRPSGDTRAQDGYVIRIDGVLAARGTVRADLRFAPVSPEVARELIGSEVVREPHPATGSLGCWVDEAGADALEAQGHEVLPTPLNYLLRHLRQVFRLNVADLLGLQETEAVIRAWTDTIEKKSLLDELLVDPYGKVRLADLLRTLARDGLPLSGDEILDAVHHAGLDADDAGPTVRQIRLALKQHLPGNGPQDVLIDVPVEWERRLAPSLRLVNGRLRLDASPRDLVALSGEMVRWMDPSARGVTLVTADADVRPFLQRLVRAQYPLATILAADEVVRRPVETPAEASPLARAGDSDA